ncbi:MAG: L-histidine N(alpha)-methyltransferase [Vicinamibacterales bacterium]
MTDRSAHAAGPSDSRIDAIWARAYDARTRDDLKQLYADWARTYDEDHEQVGFFGHRLSAEVLSRHLTRHDSSRVLDAGAGTGAAGEALTALGFNDLVAVDLSDDMLDRAREKGIYSQVLTADLSLPVDSFGEDSFDAAILVGVFSYGQAPAETLDEVLRLVRPGGLVVFTMRTDFHAEDGMGVRSRMRDLERRGRWHLLECTEPEPYLPRKDPKAMFQVWCYRVTGRKTPEVEDGFEHAVRSALENELWVKKIDHSWIWDSTATRLYNRYTLTPGYYLTDCEEEILRDHAAEILGEQSLVVELGCGSARKISHILNARVEAGGRVRYLPIDVSKGALKATEADVRGRFGDQVRVEPRQGLFDDVLPELPVGEKKVVFFFGSSIGNIESVEDTVQFLKRLRSRLNEGDRLIVGMDLHKDEATLKAAYGEGEACRSFFVHMVRRINEYLGADFDPRVFQLASVYQEEQTPGALRAWRMSLRVAPTERQHTLVRSLGLEVQLEPGQPVQVGISRKFEPEGIGELAAMAGLRLSRQWLDGRRWFSLNEFVRA